MKTLMMPTRRNSVRRATRVKQAALRLLPMVETCEERIVLSNTGFLQGTVFIDNNNDNKLDVNDTMQAGALVELFASSNLSTPLQSVTTGADGSYLFTGLAPGDYRLKETAPTGYRNAATQTISPLNPVTATTSSTIDVTVQDLSNTDANSTVTVKYYSTQQFSTYAPINVSFYFNNNTAKPATAGLSQLPVTVAVGSGADSAKFATYCVDLVDELSYPGIDTFTANGVPTSSAFPPGVDGGRIAFLYQQYGSVLSAPTTYSQALDQSALQLAIWKLEYDPTQYTTDFTHGNIRNVQITGTVSSIWQAQINAVGVAAVRNDLLNRAIAYINQSEGHTGQAIVLKTSELNAVPPNGFQDVLAPGTLNFGNTPKLNPAITTQAAAGGPVGTVLQDVATLTGGENLTGTISFTLTAPDGTVIDVGSVAVAGAGVYYSPTVASTQVGYHQWHAHYSGDANNNSADDQGGADEGVTTIKASLSLTTQAAAGGVVGTVLQDVAVLTGGYQPGGTISFTLTAPDGTVIDVGSVAVTGAGTYYSPTVASTQVGYHQWHAHYSGDANNNSADDQGGADEGVTTTKASPTIATIASAGGVIGVTSTYDTATLTGGYNPTGTITFTLYDSSNQVVFTDSDVSFDEYGVAVSESYTPTAAGTYQWVATYSGDDNNNIAIDNGENESVTITKAKPSIVTVASFTGDGKVGSVLKDTATLSGAYQPGGTITFTVTAPNGATSPAGTATVVAGTSVYYSSQITTTMVGTYTFQASYSGDGNNFSAIDDGTNESVVITSAPTKANPTISTVAIANCGNVVGTATMYDTATLSGGITPGGTIVFTVTAPDGTVINVGSVTVTGNKTYTSPKITATQVGTYVWHAHYSGDSKNYAADDNGVNESVTIVKDSPTIVTTPAITVNQCNTYNNYGCGSYGPPSGCGSYSTNNYYGSSQSSVITLTDTAVLSGGYKETGTLTFKLYLGTTLLSTETVKVNGAGTYKTPKGYQLPKNASAGIYQWNVTYSGDSKNNSFADIDNPCEQIIISNPDDSNSYCGSGGGSSGNFGSSKDRGEIGGLSFWNGSQGQALIKAFNGGSTKTNLGNWLANTYSNLFGSLKGYTNAQVASTLQSYARSSSKAANAEVLSLALNVYATNSNLSGNCGQSYYGVNVTAFGLGSSTVFLDSFGKEIGLSDNGSCTVLTLLQKINGLSKSGTINSSSYSAANSLCRSINQI